MSAAHSCPGPECDEMVARSMLACGPHWAQVPGPLKRAVYVAWDRGAGAGTEQHAAAMRAAISHMTPIRRGERRQ